MNDLTPSDNFDLIDKLAKRIEKLELGLSFIEHLKIKLHTGETISIKEKFEEYIKEKVIA